MSGSTVESNSLVTNALESQLLADIARRFYIDESSQVEIAKDLGLSRFKVARLLRRARDIGMVRISIVTAVDSYIELASKISSAWDIARVFVFPTGDSPGETRRNLAQSLAAYLVETSVRNDVIGLSAGTTNSIMVEYLSGLPAHSVVQVTGALGASVVDSPVEMIRRVATITDADVFPLYCPLIMESRALADKLRSHPDIQRTNSMFEKVTRLVGSIGSWSEGGSAIYDAAGSSDQEQGHRRGAVGEYLGILFTESGDVVFSDFSYRCMSVPLGVMRQIPDKIMSTPKSPSLNALQGVLRSRLADTLIIDSDTARRLDAAS